MFGSPGTRMGHRPRDQAWTQIDAWNGAQNPSFAIRDYDVSDFNALRLIGSVGLSGNSWRTFRVSVNGGLSFLSAAASYLLLNVNGLADQSDTEGYLHSTSSAAARFVWLTMQGLRDGYPQYQTARTSVSGQTMASFVDNSNPVTHLRLFSPSGLSWNSGSFKLFGR